MTGRQEYDRTKDRQRILGKYMIDVYEFAGKKYVVIFCNLRGYSTVGKPQTGRSIASYLCSTGLRALLPPVQYILIYSE